LAAIGLAAALGFAAPARAQATAAPVATERGPRWSELSAQQQQALKPLQGEWSGIDAARKRKWIEVASKFQTMAPAERQRVEERMAEWSRLTPAERGRARAQFQEARRLPAEDRQAHWEAYQALPEDQRRALADRSAAPAARAGSRREARGGEADGVKRNIVTAVPATPPAPVKPVAPTIVQAAPGVTTTLVTKRAAPPAHNQPGLPKIAATQTFVDQATLLPKRGPQGAGVAAAPATADKKAQ
jgi:hypothetical protein